MKNGISRFVYVLAASALVIALFTSCKKEKTLSKTEMLVRSWKLIDLIATINGVSGSVYSSEVQPCQQDDSWEFAKGGTYLVKDIGTKCPGGADIVSSGTWQFLDNETKILVDPSDDDPYTGTIDEISASSLKISADQTFNGVPAKATFVYKAQ
jgi:hypothetical protein